MSSFLRSVLRRGVWLCATTLPAVFLVHQALRAESASSEPTCQIADETTAAALADQWVAAISSQHPDHISRLFARDGAFQGFASPQPRASYASIREYYLYFFQFMPQVRMEESQLEGGCNYLIQTGNYTWFVKKTEASPPADLQARYRVLYEFIDGRWQIGEHVEELTVPEAEKVSFNVPAFGDPQEPIVASATGTAVAGYLFRPDAVVPTVKALGRPQSTEVRSRLGGLRERASRRTIPTISQRPPLTNVDQSWKANVFNPG